MTTHVFNLSEVRILLNIKYGSHFRAEDELEDFYTFVEFTRAKEEIEKLRIEQAFVQKPLNRSYASIKNNFNQRRKALELLTLQFNLNRPRPRLAHMEELKLYLKQAFTLYHRTIKCEGNLFLLNKHQRFFKFRNAIKNKPMLAGCREDFKAYRKLAMFKDGYSIYQLLKEEVTSSRVLKEQGKTPTYRPKGRIRQTIHDYDKILMTARRVYHGKEELKHFMEMERHFFSVPFNEFMLFMELVGDRSDDLEFVKFKYHESTGTVI